MVLKVSPEISKYQFECERNYNYPKTYKNVKLIQPAVFSFMKTDNLLIPVIAKNKQVVEYEEWHNEG